MVAFEIHGVAEDHPLQNRPLIRIYRFIDRIEDLTILDFLTTLNDEIEDSVISGVDWKK